MLRLVWSGRSLSGTMLSVWSSLEMGIPGLSSAKSPTISTTWTLSSTPVWFFPLFFEFLFFSYVLYLHKCLLVLRIGSGEDCHDSTWRQWSLCCSGYNQDQEAEQAFFFPPQISHEEGFPEDGQSCEEPGNQPSSAILLLVLCGSCNEINESRFCWLHRFS